MKKLEKQERGQFIKSKGKNEKHSILNSNIQLLNSKSGITLIALVVTIVILLILAGITINLVLAEGGLFERAQGASEAQKKAEARESVELMLADYSAEKATKNKDLKEYLEEQKQAENLQKVTESTDGTKITVEKDGYEITINKETLEIISVEKNGRTVLSTTPQPTALLEGWDSNKVTAVKSLDSTPVTVPIPKGFTPSSVVTENKVATGFVIYEGTEEVNSSNVETAKTSRNQFVWVPVTKDKPMFTTTTIDNQTVNVGQLYNFSGTTSSPITYSSTGFREPDILEDTTSGDASTTDGRGISQLTGVVGITGGNNTEILANWETELRTKFEKMKTSVETYGGFYIGRYETGNLVATKDTAPVVRKGNTAIASVNWYYMYQNSKSIVQNAEAKATGIKSSMIWGTQWDAAMNWFLSSSDTAVKNYVTNSEGKGNYAGTQGSTNVAIATGKDGYDVNNIYDMAGNVFDWTLEACGVAGRVARGGCNWISSSVQPASVRVSYSPYGDSSNNGSRSTLIM